MVNMNPLLLCDYYKTTHGEQYPKGIQKIVSYFTPRMSRIEDMDKLVMFGLQGFIKDYLIKAFSCGFFRRPESDVVDEYERIMRHTLKSTLGYRPDIQKIRDLHNLGFLPIKIRAIPEGERVDIGVPMIEISNTHREFAWVTNAIETLMSCSLWHAMISANVGYKYRKIVDGYYAWTVDDNVPRRGALGDFSMRGQESVESAMRSSAAWLLSFVNTATVPAVVWLERNYNCDIEDEDVGYGAVSTEHSVMCSNYAVDGDEYTMLKRLLTEIYPLNSFSVVCDSYDYWNVVEGILPQLKEEILAHQGFMAIRGDSGDPVEITTKTVFNLWDIFGGTVNSKGYKVLNPKIKVIYGDSITPIRCREIYSILQENGFASNNVSLGVGSFSMQCYEQEYSEYHLPRLLPFTRDTFGIAVKSTYGIVDDEEIFIYKDPKTDDGHFKKSMKGCCIVKKNEDGKWTYMDEFSHETALEYEEKLGIYENYTGLTEVFNNGMMITEYSLKEIRQRLHDGKF